MKQPVIAMPLQPGICKVNGIKNKIQLPKGCTGFLFCFESKQAAREWFGRDIPLVEIEEAPE